MKLTTTINLLCSKPTWFADSKVFKFYKEEMQKLIDHLGHDYDHDKPINLLTILEYGGIHLFFTCFLNLEPNWDEIFKILILKNIVIDIAEYTLDIFEEYFPEDGRLRKTIEKAIEAAKYEIDIEKLELTVHEAMEARTELFLTSLGRLNKEYAAASTAVCAAMFSKTAAEKNFTECLLWADQAAAESWLKDQIKIDIIKKYLSWD